MVSVYGMPPPLLLQNPTQIDADATMAFTQRSDSDASAGPSQSRLVFRGDLGPYSNHSARETVTRNSTASPSSSIVPNPGSPGHQFLFETNSSSSYGPLPKHSAGEIRTYGSPPWSAIQRREVSEIVVSPNNVASVSSFQIDTPEKRQLRAEIGLVISKVSKMARTSEDLF